MPGVSAGDVQDTSYVTIPAPSVVGTTPTVQTSFADRYKLKSSTSREFRLSRKRTLTAFAVAVELTTDSSVLFCAPGYNVVAKMSRARAV